jgi:tetratricopeptide (TPR) repeat protein
MAIDRIPQLLAFLEEDPANAFLRFALAMEYVKADRLEEARTQFEELLRDDPSYVGAYYHLGKLYERLGRKADAIETYRTGIQQADLAREQHFKSELQAALLEAQGIGFDDE